MADYQRAPERPQDEEDPATLLAQHPPGFKAYPSLQELQPLGWQDYVALTFSLIAASSAMLAAGTLYAFSLYGPQVSLVSFCGRLLSLKKSVVTQS